MSKSIFLLPVLPKLTCVVLTALCAKYDWGLSIYTRKTREQCWEYAGFTNLWIVYCLVLYSKVYICESVYSQV